MASTGRRDDRSAEAEAYRVLYRDRRWRGTLGVRTRQLADHPLCAMCEAEGRVTPATVCDHVDPRSKDSEATFYRGPFQSLCCDCHDRKKQKQEKSGYHADIGPDGLPTDPLHPFNSA
jgi:hypothetical protein